LVATGRNVPQQLCLFLLAGKHAVTQPTPSRSNSPELLQPAAAAAKAALDLGITGLESY
jgi:hypothetical protein